MVGNYTWIDKLSIPLGSLCVMMTTTALYKLRRPTDCRELYGTDAVTLLSLRSGSVCATRDSVVGAMMMTIHQTDDGWLGGMWWAVGMLNRIDAIVNC